MSSPLIQATRGTRKTHQPQHSLASRWGFVLQERRGIGGLSQGRDAAADHGRVAFLRRFVDQFAP